jgi:O-antigen/teichoic acid export membrane protein
VTRAFFKNLLWLQALNWLIKPIWILWIERTVQVQLGNEWYGQYFVHFNLGLLFAVLLDAGLNTYVSREVASEGFLINKNRIIKLRLILGGFYVFLVLLLSYFQALNFKIISLVIVNQILASILLMVRAILQGRQLFKSDAVLSVLDRWVAIVVSAWFLFGSNSFEGLNGIVVFLGAQTMGYVLALILGAYFLYFKGNSYTPESHLNRESPDFKAWGKTVFWYVAMALFMSVFTRVDSLMIRNLSPDFFGFTGFESGYFQAGIYAQSYRLLDAGLIFSTLLSTQLLPIFSKNLKDKLSNKKLIWLAFRLVLLVGLMALFTAILFGGTLMEILYGAKWEGGADAPWAKSSTEIFIILMGAFIAMSSIHIFGTFITAKGEVKWLAKLAFVVMLINVGLNFLWIPTYGAKGAALSALCAQFLFAIACSLKVSWGKLEHLKTVKWKTIPMSILFLGIIVLFIHNVPELPQKNMIMYLAWFMGFTGVVWMLFGRDVKKIFNGRAWN